MSSTAVLKIVLTNDLHNEGAIISVDYSTAAGEYSVIGFTSNQNAATIPFLPITLDTAVDNGSVVSGLNATSIAHILGDGLPAGQNYLVGTITFKKNGSDTGASAIDAFVGTNDFISGTLHDSLQDQSSAAR